MGSPRRYNQNVDPFQEARYSDSSTAYRGAEGDLDLPPAVHVDRDGYEDVRLNDRSRTSPSRDGGFGSRLLSNAQPAAAALARSGSVLHTRARSWAAYVPKLNTNSSNTSTPEKQETATRSRPQSRLIDSFFNGESAPVHLGVPTSPTKEKNEAETEFVMEYRPGFTERPRTQRKDSAKTPTQPQTNTRKTSSSWFSRKASSPTPTRTAPANVVDDKMLKVNINNALFPHGPADPLSPQAFNDLLLNANSLLQRMQAAYKEKVDFIASIQPEIDAQKEEVEEACTRSEHLKMQLEDIGRKQEEQLQVNEELIIQLSKEKMKVQELQEQAKSTVRLVRRDTGEAEGEDSSTDDDAQRRRKRSSGDSTSDSGFESDADTASVFSAGVETPRSGVSSIQPRVFVTLDHQSQPQVRYASSRDSRISQQSTMFPSRSSGGKQAADSSTLTAWATVERLRNENAELRGWVEAMQSELQGVIDFVGGVKV